MNSNRYKSEYLVSAPVLGATVGTNTDINVDSAIAINTGSDGRPKNLGTNKFQIKLPAIPLLITAPTDAKIIKKIR